MKTLVRCVTITVLLFLASCQSKKTVDAVEEFSAEKPYCLEIKKERSYYQARKIADRLNEMGLEAYVILRKDSVDGEWFSILSGALVNTDSVANYQQRVEQMFKLKDVQVVNYNELESHDFAREGDTTIIRESKKITAFKPDVPEAIMDVTHKYPDNNAFYLEQISLVNFDIANREDAFSSTTNMNLDLPRGISIRKIASKCNAFSEAKYKDNLYGDKVTLGVMRLRANHSVAKASLLPALEKRYLDIAGEYATYILDTDKYPFEEMTEITIPAYCSLYGYKVVIETKKDVRRTYYILVDEFCQYLFFAQSTDKSDTEMTRLLSMIGKSDGLDNYDEFYNTFYVLPDKCVDQDVFLGYHIGRLTWEYAKEKNYANWSKAMVGYWRVSGWFYNPRKGVWDFSIFDLLTDDKQQHIYGSLYAKSQHANSKKNIYGVKGYLVDINYGWYAYKELNFGIGRYVYAIGSYSSLNEADLTARAKAMQFVAGGYRDE